MLSALGRGDGMTVTMLRALAKKYRVEGYSRMRKAELIIFLPEIAKYEVARFEFNQIKVVKLEFLKPTKFEFEGYKGQMKKFEFEGYKGQMKKFEYESYEVQMKKFEVRISQFKRN